jgi:hypothetical protein
MVFAEVVVSMISGTCYGGGNVQVLLEYLPETQALDSVG